MVPAGPGHPAKDSETEPRNLMGKPIRCPECGEVYRTLDRVEDLRDNDGVCLVCNAPIEVANWDRILESYEEEDDLDDVDELDDLDDEDELEDDEEDVEEEDDFAIDEEEDEDEDFEEEEDS